MSQTVNPDAYTAYVHYLKPPLGPEEYRGVKVPHELRSNWDVTHVRVAWWKAGVDASKQAKLGRDDSAKRSANERRRKKCIGKYAYDDPYAALREMFALPYREPELTDHDICLYRCEFCDYWHLGRMTKAWWQLEPTPVSFQVAGQQMIPYPELKDFNPQGFRNLRRDGEPYA